MDKADLIHQRLHEVIEIANTDPEGQRLAHKLNDGVLLFRVPGCFEAAVLVQDGKLTVIDSSAHPKAVCEFSDADSAWALMNRELSPYAATVHKQLNQYGLSPMNDAFEKLWLLTFDRISASPRKEK
ncbi:MAG: hypothetical protein J5889_04795 [Clostridia bacterium]|nr:hypothetical protein [Clostridia bacterium]